MIIKERSYDILDKNQLKQFNMKKLFNHKEIFFHIIHYLENVKLDEAFDADKDFEEEDFEKCELEEEPNKEEGHKEENEEEQKNKKGANEKKENINNISINEPNGEIELNSERRAHTNAKDDDNLSDSKFKKYLRKGKYRYKTIVNFR